MMPSITVSVDFLMQSLYNTRDNNIQGSLQRLKNVSEQAERAVELPTRNLIWIMPT